MTSAGVHVYVAYMHRVLEQTTGKKKYMRGIQRAAKRAVEETGATLESEHDRNRRCRSSTAERVRRSRAASQVRDRANM